MGTVSSACYRHLKRFVNRYNVQYRTHKFLEKNNLPLAPTHEGSREALKASLYANEKLKKEFHEEYMVKNKQLNEYLKKVYLTSNSVAEIKSQRMLPVKVEEVTNIIKFFKEPDDPRPNHITLTSILKMLVQHKEDPNQWNVPSLAKAYNLQKESVVNLLSYYSLYRNENFDFFNKDLPEEKQEVAIEVYSQFTKQPLKQIKDK